MEKLSRSIPRSLSKLVLQCSKSNNLNKPIALDRCVSSLSSTNTGCYNYNLMQANCRNIKIAHSSMQHIILKGRQSELLLETQILRRFASKDSSGDKNNLGDMSNYVVGHDRTEQYFYIQLKDPSGERESLAILQYSWVKPGHVDLYHTEVPTDFQRQGIAKHLVLASLDTFSMENTIIRPSCTYVQKVLRENPVPPRYVNHLEKGYMKF